MASQPEIAELPAPGHNTVRSTQRRTDLTPRPGANTGAGSQAT